MTRTFAAVVQPIFEPHQKLHESAKAIQADITAGDRPAAYQVYQARTEPAMQATLGAIDGVIAWHDGLMERFQQVLQVFNTQTRPNLEKVAGLLDQAKTVVTDNIMNRRADAGGGGHHPPGRDHHRRGCAAPGHPAGRGHRPGHHQAHTPGRGLRQEHGPG